MKKKGIAILAAAGWSLFFVHSCFYVEKKSIKYPTSVCRKLNLIAERERLIDRKSGKMICESTLSGGFGIRSVQIASNGYDITFSEYK